MYLTLIAFSDQTHLTETSSKRAASEQQASSQRAASEDRKTRI